MTYNSPYAALNTPNRFALALKLAGQYHLDVSRIMFTYLKVAEAILQNHSGRTISPTLQRKIDDRFTKTLQALAAGKDA